MKEIVLDIIKIVVIFIGVYFIITLVINDKTDIIQEKLDKIETNSKHIDSILTITDSIKGERIQVINNIDRRTTIINQQKSDLKKVLPKDTNFYNVINYLHDFAK